MPAPSRNRGHRLAAYRRCSPDPRTRHSGPPAQKQSRSKRQLDLEMALWMLTTYSSLLVEGSGQRRLLAAGAEGHGSEWRVAGPSASARQVARRTRVTRACSPVRSEGRAMPRRTKRGEATPLAEFTAARLRPADDGPVQQHQARARGYSDKGTGESRCSGLESEPQEGGVRGPANKAMKLTRLSAAPGWFRGHQTRGAASCPRWRETAGTASQLIAGVGRTSRG